MTPLRLLPALLLAAVAASAQNLSGELLTKLQARITEVRSFSTDAELVSALRTYNATPPVEAQGLDNKTWRTLSVLDPRVRYFSKNPAARHLKALRQPWMSEMFLSGAAGTKLAFVAKPSNWSHAGKEKHSSPMQGATWIGPIELDGSTGQQQVQFSLPILDNGRPIGSLVIAVPLSKL